MRTSALLVVATSLGCSSGHTAMGARPPAHVKAAAAVAGDVVETTEYIATIKSRSSVTIYPQVAGHVAAIFAKPGDEVRAGAPLLEIDPAKQQAAFLSSRAAAETVRADLERAKATLVSLDATRKSKASALVLAQQDFTRTEALLKTSSVSQADYDQAKAKLDQAREDLASTDAQLEAQRAALESSKRSLEQAQSSAQEQAVELKYYKIAAPFDGAVGDIPVKLGDYVTPTTKLTSVDQNSGLEAYLSIPVEESARLKLELPVKLLDSSGQPLADSHITFVSPEINEDTQSILVKTRLDTPPPDVRTEQFVRARVVWATHPGLRVPMGAVVRLNGQPFVYVLQGGTPSTVKQTPVTLGEIDGNDVAVAKGLAAGDRVVASGVQKLADGAPVVVDP